MKTLTTCNDGESRPVPGALHGFPQHPPRARRHRPRLRPLGCFKAAVALGAAGRGVGGLQGFHRPHQQEAGMYQHRRVSTQPDNPNAAAARGKFLSEHGHDDFETRLFVDGQGIFNIRKDGKVYMTLCTRGDLINLPATTAHWFDLGERPFFKAIRLVRIPEGWVGKFTGDTISGRFPKYQAALEVKV